MLHMVNFEITTIIFLIILIVFFYTRNRLFTLKNKYYYVFIVTTLISSVFCILSKLLNAMVFDKPVDLVYIITVGMYVFYIMNMVTFMLYVLSATHRIKYITTFKYLAIFIPAITCTFMMIITYKTKFFFYLNKAGNLIKTKNMFFVLAVEMFYVAICLYFVIKYRKKLSKMCMFGIYFLLSIFSVMAIVQFVFNLSEFYINSSIIISAVVIYLAAQNPDYYINMSNGMLNKDAFKIYVEEQIENNIPFNCVAVKIEEFNTLTEIFGTIKCDGLVKMVGEYLRDTFKESSVFMITSSQFIIVDKVKNLTLPDYDNRISKRFEEKWTVDSTDITVSKALCGISYPDYYGDVDELLGITKFALTEATKTNSMSIVGDYLIDKMNHNLAVEKAVEKAIKANAVQVYYQPIYSAKEKCVTCAEALSRLIDDELGFIPPDEFIRVAEENGSILTLGKQIFEKVCIFINSHDLEKLKIQYIEVNLSPIQCMQKELAVELIAIADKYNIPMSKFNLEITESATTDSKDHIKINMEMLCNADTTFSLDDYGTGFSNITAIMDLPFKYVKIDKSIVWAYFDNTNSILEYLVDMFKRENLYIITEGVETEEQYHKLIEMGCDYLQGFYFSKAIPGDDFVAYLGG